MFAEHQAHQNSPAWWLWPVLWKQEDEWKAVFQGMSALEAIQAPKKEPQTETGGVHTTRLSSQVTLNDSDQANPCIIRS